MKHIFMVFVLVAFFVFGLIGMSYAQKVSGSTTDLSSIKCESNGLKTADGVIKLGRKTICGISVHPDGSNACTIVLYDNTSTNSGTVLLKHVAPGDTVESSGQMPPFVVESDLGIYADMITSGTCGFIVYTKKE